MMKEPIPEPVPPAEESYEVEESVGDEHDQEEETEHADEEENQHADEEVVETGTTTTE